VTQRGVHNRASPHLHDGLLIVLDPGDVRVFRRRRGAAHEDQGEGED